MSVDSGMLGDLTKSTSNSAIDFHVAMVFGAGCVKIGAGTASSPLFVSGAAVFGDERPRPCSLALFLKRAGLRSKMDLLCCSICVVIQPSPFISAKQSLSTAV